MKRIILRRGEERRIQMGHPWVYDNEIHAVLAGKGDAAAELDAGECADVESLNKHYLGRAFVNPASKITARIYSPSKEGADLGFFKRRIRDAALRREKLGGETSCRLVFGEADFIPGLIVDRYVGWSFCDVTEAALTIPLEARELYERLGPPSVYLVVQILCAGIEVRCDMVMRALRELFPQAIITEKSPPAVRELEAMPPREPLADGAIPLGGVVIFENGYPFIVDLLEGQKTGFFLDQRENHAAAAAFAKDRRVLDAFCYSGGFAIHAARAGAREVIAADSSGTALTALHQNAALNRVEDRVNAVESDIFQLLTRYERAKERFELVILDPPAFAKSRANLEAAAAGYKEINLKALKLLETGGVLVSCSCSFALTEERFKRVIALAARDAERRIVQTAFRTQADCHPILAGYDESQYLKCGIYTVVA